METPNAIHPCVGPSSFLAFSRRLKSTVRRHKFDKDSLARASGSDSFTFQVWGSGGKKVRLEGGRLRNRLRNPRARLGSDGYVHFRQSVHSRHGWDCAVRLPLAVLPSKFMLSVQGLGENSATPSCSYPDTASVGVHTAVIKGCISELRSISPN